MKRTILFFLFLITIPVTDSFASLTEEQSQSDNISGKSYTDARTSVDGESQKNDISVQSQASSSTSVDEESEEEESPEGDIELHSLELGKSAVDEALRQKVIKLINSLPTISKLIDQTRRYVKPLLDKLSKRRLLFELDRELILDPNAIASLKDSIDAKTKESLEKEIKERVARKVIEKEIYERVAKKVNEKSRKIPENVEKAKKPLIPVKMSPEQHAAKALLSPLELWANTIVKPSNVCTFEETLLPALRECFYDLAEKDKQILTTYKLMMGLVSIKEINHQQVFKRLHYIIYRYIHASMRELNDQLVAYLIDLGVIDQTLQREIEELDREWEILTLIHDTNEDIKETKKREEEEKRKQLTLYNRMATYLSRSSSSSPESTSPSSASSAHISESTLVVKEGTTIDDLRIALADQGEFPKYRKKIEIDWIKFLPDLFIFFDGSLSLLPNWEAAAYNSLEYLLPKCVEEYEDKLAKVTVHLISHKTVTVYADSRAEEQRVLTVGKLPTEFKDIFDERTYELLEDQYSPKFDLSENLMAKVKILKANKDRLSPLEERLRRHHLKSSVAPYLRGITRYAEQRKILTDEDYEIFFSKEINHEWIDISNCIKFYERHKRDGRRFLEDLNRYLKEYNMPGQIHDQQHNQKTDKHRIELKKMWSFKKECEHLKAGTILSLWKMDNNLVKIEDIRFEREVSQKIKQEYPQRLEDDVYQGTWKEWSEKGKLKEDLYKSIWKNWFEKSLKHLKLRDREKKISVNLVQLSNVLDTYLNTNTNTVTINTPEEEGGDI